MIDILKVAALGITAALCAVVVKKQARELGLVLALAAGALILGGALRSVEQVRSFLDTLADMAQISPAVLAPVLKTVGISIITRITAELCRDAGEGGIAAFVETAGAALALCVSVPLLQAVLSTLNSLF
ncbi:stage III sporulation protein AD [Pseudoflavonifractor sp. 524-17]|uniref:SpoIIIAC/SpoIIIAD family protein n=1 Tax=Pseudoflavonifractor sp. 524-17 TaxID=2304577 RepID=UPI00137A7F60|nr:SpoIIIAC/SpoIIIAD family protein [Pseudoflavonifractor sp. 524-17]NCE64299.1 stage III sporulation protein AD [Pseudoflavonifractor sp. 524-17]